MPPLGLSCPVLRWTLDSVVVPVLARCKPGQTTACCPHYPPSPAITQHNTHHTTPTAQTPTTHHPPHITHHPPHEQLAHTHAHTHAASKQQASNTHTHTRTHMCVRSACQCVRDRRRRQRLWCVNRVLHGWDWMRMGCIRRSPTTSMSCLHW